MISAKILGSPDDGRRLLVVAPRTCHVHILKSRALEFCANICDGDPNEGIFSLGGRRPDECNQCTKYRGGVRP